MDYDGTLCSSENRFGALSSDISEELNRILKRGFIIGIATGRGKSVREELQKVVNKKYYNNVIIGYYNGSDIGTLNDTNHPDKTIQTHPSLIIIEEKLKDVQNPFLIYEVETRPHQLTIKKIEKKNWVNIRNSLDIIMLCFMVITNIRNYNQSFN